jgi:hypothetical protein
VTPSPRFEDLVDPVDDPQERDRLRGVHELLVQAGPPPELSPALATIAPPDDSAATVDEERDFAWLPRRRLGAGLVLVGAVLAATFGGGYLAGGSGSDGSERTAGIQISRSVALTGDGNASAVVNVGRRDADGNWPMILTVRGLPPLTEGDYYVLALSKDGKPTVTCGTFNVSTRGQRTLRMSAAYNLKGFDGWVVTRYDAKTHHERPVLWTKPAKA